MRRNIKITFTSISTNKTHTHTCCICEKKKNQSVWKNISIFGRLECRSSLLMIGDWIESRREWSKSSIWSWSSSICFRLDVFGEIDRDELLEWRSTRKKSFGEESSSDLKGFYSDWRQWGKNLLEFNVWIRRILTLFSMTKGMVD